MELHFSHANRVLCVKPRPLETINVTLTSNSKLAQMLNQSIKKLTSRGELTPEHARLIDRRPVHMKPSTTKYNPPAKAKVRSTKAVAYDSPLLNSSQRACQTNTTKGEALDMKNWIAAEKSYRKSLWIDKQKERKSADKVDQL